MLRLLVFLLFLVPIFCSAQHTNFNTRSNWALNKKEVFFGGGITQFTGDLGGINKLGSEYKLSDLSFPSTGWNSSAGYRYRFRPRITTTSVVQFGMIRGNDALKIDPYRNSRNLHFRSLTATMMQRIDLILSLKERTESRYGVRNKVNFYYQLYAYSAIGILYFDPRAKYEGKWVALQPLRTEGQGLSGGPKQYHRITASIPLGIGLSWAFSRMWRIGFEFDHNFTFSDYMDDVGGTYYDPNQLATEVNETSAYLSNPATQNTEWFTTGQRRGDKGYDGYYTFNILLKRNVTYKDYAGKRKSRRRFEFDE